MDGTSEGLNLSYSSTIASARNFTSYFLFLQNIRETFGIEANDEEEIHFRFLSFLQLSSLKEG